MHGGYSLICCCSRVVCGAPGCACCLRVQESCKQCGQPTTVKPADRHHLCPTCKHQRYYASSAAAAASPPAAPSPLFPSHSGSHTRLSVLRRAAIVNACHSHMATSDGPRTIGAGRSLQTSKRFVVWGAAVRCGSVGPRGRQPIRSTASLISRIRSQSRRGAASARTVLATWRCLKALWMLLACATSFVITFCRR